MRHGRFLLRQLVLAICAAVMLGAVGAGSAAAAGITNSGGDLRDGWYPNQPKLSPDAVAGSNFGKLWDKPVDGQVYAQPLVVDTSPTKKSVIVATEGNHVYSFDSETGDSKWTRDLGTPFPYTLIGWGCGDLTPDIGVTATPVIDEATKTIYLTHKTFAPGSMTDAAYYMDALDVETGEQRPGFPVQLSGTAQNAPGVTFEATTELQRPGLLLLDGVVYAGFGGHCDIPPYQGWVFGVSTAGEVKARWSAVTSGSGAGIWQSGSGLMSDGPGRVFVSTGNGGSPTPPLAAPGNGLYGESIVRLNVQADGTLQPADFFAPSDAEHLDSYDADFASGGVTALRDSFGTSQYPHLGVAVGKAGYVYLLNRDDLGGIGTGDGRGDRVVSRVGPYGGVWSRPGVWPGDGGWIAIPTASPSAGEHASGSSGYLKLYRYRVSNAGLPSLDAPIQSDDAFGFSSSAPVITSDGTTSGSAVLWIIWSPDGGGNGAQLRAYDAVPQNGHLKLRHSWPIGRSAKFTMPGVGDGRIYVGTRDGHIQAYGAPVQAQVAGPSTTFPLTTVGAKSTVDVKLTIGGSVKVNSIVASSSPFAAGTPTPALPATFSEGDTITVPVDFTPTTPGVTGGTLTVNTDDGPFAFTLTGTGQAQAAVLTASPPIVSFGGAVVGESRASVVTFGNGGGQPLTVTGVTLTNTTGANMPFSVEHAPAVDDVIGPGEAVNVTVHYRPTEVGEFNEDLILDTTAGQKTVGLSGIAGLGPKLTLAPAGGWEFGDVTIGESKTVAVTISNTGDSPMTVTKSKPPTGARFTVLDPLDEGTAIGAGESRTLRISFTPTSTGTVADKWIINAGDGSGVHEIVVQGTGAAPPDPEPQPKPQLPLIVPPPAVPDLTPPLIGPEVDGLSRPELKVEKLRPGLSVSKALLSRDGRKITIRGRVTAAAVGPLTVKLSARVGRKTVTTATRLRLRGRATYTITLTLPKAARPWTRLQILAQFPGSDRVWPGAGTLVLVRGR